MGVGSRRADDKRRIVNRQGAAAEAAGFRPCLRCRPEKDGALDVSGVEILAYRLGIGRRHLSRPFQKHHSASPIQVVKIARVQRAKMIARRDRSLDGGDRNVRRLWQPSASQCRLLRRSAGDRRPRRQGMPSQL